MQYSSYYQARVRPQDCWFFVAVLKSFEHVAFDRTIDTETSTFEFYVPASQEQLFLSLMDYFIQNRIVSCLEKLPNRLRDTEAVF